VNAVEIECFNEVAGIITLAKELYDIGRFDIVQNEFYDSLCYDSWFENTYGVITSIFSGFYSDYDDDNETETMIFTDDVISDYFTYAWEFGVKTNTPYDKNPYVKDAENEARRRLSYCYSMDYKLLGYTKTRRAARQSKLIVYVGMCECDCHTELAYGLVRLYKWFSDKVAEFRALREATGVMEVQAA
jgi:hypothetical protein